MFTDVVLALSNLAFFLPFVRSIRKHRWTRAAVYFLLVFVSGFYHACYSSMNLCFVTHAVHQHLDFFLSELLIPLTGLYFIDWTPRFAFIERWIIIVVSFVIFLVRSNPMIDENTFQYALIGSSVSIVLFAALLGTVKYKIHNAILGLLFTIAAFVFFIQSQHYPLEYWVLHSLWHIFAAIGQFIILDIWEAAPRLANMDTQMIYIKPIISV